MPEIEEKTPVYDVVVHLEAVGEVIVAEKVTLKSAADIRDNLRPAPSTMVNHYYYPPAEDNDLKSWLSKTHIIKCDIRRSTRMEYIPPTDIWDFGRTVYHELFLEDLENEND